MKLYKIYNGYTGFSAVYVIVVAKDDEEAYQLASNQFKKNGERLYTESYWTNLELVMLSEDLTQLYVSEVEE